MELYMLVDALHTYVCNVFMYAGPKAKKFVDR